MTETELLDRMALDADLLLEAAAQAGWDAPVPTLSWDVRTVVAHQGAVHRWSADLVRRALPTNETGGSIAFWPHGVPDDDLPAWFTEGVAALVATLRAAPADLGCYVMLRDVAPREFWIRRQAHETAIHRADVQAAAGHGPAVTGDVPAAFAQSGLAELVGGFAGERGFAVDLDAALVLRASDGPDWRVHFSADGNRVRTGADRDEPAADAEVAGSSAQLYLWAWNRPADVRVSGDPDVADRWRRIVIS